MTTARHLAFVATLLCAGAAGAAAPAAVVAPAPAAPVATPQADAAFAALDADHNGNVSREEFRAGWLAMSRAMAARERLRRQFATVDTNRDNGLDAGEYSKLLLVREAGAAAPAFATFDADKNQKLDFAEYLELVKQLAPQNGGAATAGSPGDEQ